MRIVRNLTAAIAVVVLTVAGIATAVADDPPPRIAFLANGIVPADALAAGPIAGQLGAPIFTTAPDALVESTATALDAYDPELVIVMGGPAAISDAVLGQVAATTGLTVVPSSPPPSNGIVRAAGEDRFETATAAAALLTAYDPAFLPTDMRAVDSDKLDGKDSSAFQPAGAYALADRACAAGKVVTGIAADGTPTCATDKVGAAFDGDADTLDGKDSTAFQPAGDYALAGQTCGLGERVSGITALGHLTCSTDAIDGGDAETVDGMDSSAFGTALGDADAAAAVNANGTIRTSTPNIDSIVWNATYGWYEVTFTDLYFSLNAVAVASIAGDTPGFVATTSVSGKLLIVTDDVSGASAQRPFTFAVWDLTE